ncbi:amidohydrolase [Pontibacter diazotrophicus]|uniref:Amidohydrolase n=1 Tax=Pontibacter diazotrophicus TaxID=1400979 RepID=A0A3D8L3M2_9BACT|nr:amidohydrolase family protein [Pontibacter diazotrophicus]RDV12008.1 amidohydrolase [Pontibacter diazotrophicus]
MSQQPDKHSDPKKYIKRNISRRKFLGGSLALGAAGCAGYTGAFAQAAKSSNPQADTSLPVQGHYLIKNAYVLTMDPALGEFKSADVLIRDGEIKQVRPNLSSTGAEVLDGEGKIVMPGLVETHWHMWTSLLRSMAGNVKGRGYFAIIRDVGQHYTAESMYAATKLALAEAINSGITTVHDWSHNVRSPEFAEASLRALREAGVRGRYSLGVPAGEGAKQLDLQLLENLHSNWPNDANRLLHLGMAWAGIENRMDTGIKEVTKARQLGIPVSVHASSAGVISGLAKAGLLAEGMQIIHCKDATAAEIKSIVQAGAVVSLSPFSELRIGYGIPPVKELLDAGATIGLSADTTTLSGNADLFAVMKVFLNLANALDRSEFYLTAKGALGKGTIEGARSLGIANRTGSLTPGKRADLIMLSTNALNLGYVTDPSSIVVEAAQPANVHTVLIDGRILKRNYELTHLNKEAMIEEAKEEFQHLMQKSGW